MWITGKIFFWFFGILILFLLISITFFSSQKTSFNEFIVSDSSSGSVSSENVFFHELSFLDSISTSGGEDTFSVDTQDEKQVIEIGQGEFFVDIRDTNTFYTLSNTDFSIDIVWLGKLYIDTTNPSQYEIISFNSIIPIALKDEKTNLTVTDVFLYPHMKLVFNPNRNPFMKQADLVRISSVFSLSYLSDSFFNTQVLNTDFSEFLLSNITLQKEKNIEVQKKISQIQAAQIWSFPWEKYIKRYYNFFINDAKKKVYYKNVALGNILELIASSKKDTELVETTYQSLQLLDPYPEDQKEVLEIFNYIYKNLLQTYDEKYIYTKVNFDQLAQNLKNTKTQESNEFIALYFLDSLYSSFDFSAKYSYKNLNSFFTSYLWELWIDVQNTQEVQQNDLGYLEYFSFFLENIITSRFISESTQSDSGILSGWNLDDILSVTKWYVDLNDIIYGDKGESKAITLMYQYIGVLESLDTFIKKSFFMEQRWENNLLIKNTQNTLSNETLVLLSGNTNDIIKFYQQNNKFLDTERQRDDFIKQRYTEFQEIFKEYFVALEWYDAYVFSYTESKKNLLWVQTAGQSNDRVLSRDAFMTYISQFSGLSYPSLSLEIQDDFTYDVTGIEIQWNNFAFSLAPLSDNTIDNISINGKKLTASYKLDNIQRDWEEKIKWLSGEQREKFDFSKFFITTFLTSTGIAGDILEDRKDIIEEDPVIVVFKRDILLGNRGEFLPVRSFLQIEYQDIDVTPVQDLYNISIKDAILSISGRTKDNSTVRLDANFSSEYTLTDTKHQFRNIQLRPYQDFSKQDGKYFLGENFIQFIGSIDIQDIKTQMEAFIEPYEVIKFIYSSLSRDFSVTNLSIKYTLFNKKTVFQFDYNAQNIMIQLTNDTIEKVTVNGVSIWKTPVWYRYITDITSLITK